MGTVSSTDTHDSNSALFAHKSRQACRISEREHLDNLGHLWRTLTSGSWLLLKATFDKRCHHTQQAIKFWWNLKENLHVWKTWSQTLETLSQAVELWLTGVRLLWPKRWQQQRGRRHILLPAKNQDKTSGEITLQIMSTFARCSWEREGSVKMSLLFSYHQIIVFKGFRAEVNKHGNWKPGNFFVFFFIFLSEQHILELIFFA